MPLQFKSGKEMLEYILNGHDLYNPITEEYVFTYNDDNAICIYSISEEKAKQLDAELKRKELSYWSEILTTGGCILDDIKSAPLNWCDKCFTDEHWINAEEYDLYKYLNTYNMFDAYKGEEHYEL